MNRQSVRGIVKIDNEVILIHRIKNGEEYWVVPGGGVEEGETFVEALYRELEEELGIKVKIIKEVATIENQMDSGTVIERFYVCNFISGLIGSGKGEEFNVRSNAENVYRVCSVRAEMIKELTIKPSEIKNIILSLFDDSYVDNEVLEI